ncbi:RNA exonuclease 3 [Zancudomyces culisetae]|uniref:RNA exonuclease 3 n=1 Tax=Zancudomyces culisetae TaxID=1213189 RepID=A0A1R1PLQ4_ZANCU|nr:RNA exonuclease 3 [Zancudomyces culisetae]|eukprot:OMH81894.1 RNA exonuclease 3 [Zancudomyces culisetae]
MNVPETLVQNQTNHARQLSSTTRIHDGYDDNEQTLEGYSTSNNGVLETSDISLNVFQIDQQNDKEIKFIESLILSEKVATRMDFPMFIEPNLRQERDEITKKEIIAGLCSFNSSRKVNANRDKRNLAYMDSISLIGMTAKCLSCNKKFKVKNPESNSEHKTECHYHSGRLETKTKLKGSRSKYGVQNGVVYKCCGREKGGEPCTMGPHVFVVNNDCINNALFIFKQTEKSKVNRVNRILIINTETVYTLIGKSVSRVTVMDITGKLLLNELVIPVGEVIHTNFKFSELESVKHAKHTAKEMQRKVLALFDDETGDRSGNTLSKTQKRKRENLVTRFGKSPFGYVEF